MKENRTNNHGQSLLEYALILILVAAVVLVVLQLFGTSIGGVVSDIRFVLENPGAVPAKSSSTDKDNSDETVNQLNVSRVGEGNDLEISIVVDIDTAITSSTSDGHRSTTNCAANTVCRISISNISESGGKVSLAFEGGKTISVRYPSKFISDMLRPKNIPALIVGSGAFTTSVYGIYKVVVILVRVVTLKITILKIQLGIQTSKAIVDGLSVIAQVALVGPVPRLVSKSAYTSLLNLDLENWTDQFLAYELANRIATDKLSTSEQVNVRIRLAEHYAVKELFPKALAEMGTAESLIGNLSDSKTVRKIKEDLDAEITSIVGQFDNFKETRTAWGFAAITGQDVDAALEVGREYSLVVGMEWSVDFPGTLPENSISASLPLPSSARLHKPLSLEILVIADGFAISPSSVQILEIPASANSNEIIYVIRPLTIGGRQIEIRYYFGRHWIQSLVLTTKVIEPSLIVEKLEYASPKKPVLLVGLLLGEGGPGDQSLNDSAIMGARSAHNVLEVDIAIAKYISEATSVAQMRLWARQGRRLIVGIGPENVKAIAQVAASYKAIQFAILDDILVMDNVWSALFSEYEGDYIVGKLAAFVAEKLTLAISRGTLHEGGINIGFIGGRRTNTIDRIESAFRKGVQSYNASVPISVVSHYTGDFSDEHLGEESARKLISAGVEVIYQAAGRSGIGAIRVAQELGCLIISTGADHSPLAPNNVLASRIKNFRQPLLDVIRATNNGMVESHTEVYGLAQGALDIILPDEEKAPRLAEYIDINEINRVVDLATEEVKAGHVNFSEYLLGLYRSTSYHSVTPQESNDVIEDKGSVKAIEGDVSRRFIGPYAKNAERQPSRSLDVYREYPINVLIDIAPEDNHFAGTIFVEDEAPNTLGSRRFRLNLSHISNHDLKALNQGMQVFMDQIMGADMRTTDQMTQELLYSLALRGYQTLFEVFRQPGIEFLQNLWNANRTLNIQIISNDFFLPWEMLYPFHPDYELSQKYFWGMQHIIFRTLNFPHLAQPWLAPGHLPNRPVAGIIANRALPTVKDSEIPFFENLNMEKKISLIMLPDLDASDKVGGRKLFREFLEMNLQIAHFACKAEYIGDNDHGLLSHQDSYIAVTDNFEITLRDINGSKMESHPFVIMNACETGNLNPLYTSNFVKRFLEAGARGVVATEWKIDDEFASAFAKQLYTTLLAGWDIGSSLYAARNDLWKDRGNLSGLFYSLYAQPNIKIVDQSVFDRTVKENVA